MAIRIKSRWHDCGRENVLDKSLEEAAEALASITWRIALDKAKNLHGEDYVYHTDGQRIAVMCEYLAFQVQLADRITFDMLNKEERPAFITMLAHRVADHVEDNARDLFGPRDYRTGFIATLNDRSKEYAKFKFGADGPSYSFTRHLGFRIQSIMGDEKLNRWVIDQVMDIDAPDVYQKIRKSITDLLQ